MGFWGFELDWDSWSWTGLLGAWIGMLGVWVEILGVWIDIWDVSIAT